jgi:hypothetical protein
LDTAAITGIFTIAGVVVTASAALFAAWIKYRTDRRQELRKERKDLYARFQHATAQMWNSIFVVVKEGGQDAEPPENAAANLDQAWITWAKIWMEMSIMASDTIWPTVEPLFDEFRAAYFERDSHRRSTRSYKS